MGSLGRGTFRIDCRLAGDHAVLYACIVLFSGQTSPVFSVILVWIWFLLWNSRRFVLLPFSKCIIQTISIEGYHVRFSWFHLCVIWRLSFNFLTAYVHLIHEWFRGQQTYFLENWADLALSFINLDTLVNSRAYHVFDMCTMAYLVELRAAFRDGYELLPRSIWLKPTTGA